MPWGVATGLLLVSAMTLARLRSWPPVRARLGLCLSGLGGVAALLILAEALGWELAIPSGLALACLCGAAVTLRPALGRSVWWCSVTVLVLTMALSPAGVA